MEAPVVPKTLAIIAPNQQKNDICKGVASPFTLM